MARSTFTIVIPTLNEEKFLGKLLTSLTQQTKKDFETIVVDGNSKDKTVEIAQSFKTKLPKLKVTTCQRGVSRQRNMGARMGKNPWIVFVDADSILYPQFIERVGDYITHHAATCLTTWFKTDIDTPLYAIFCLIVNMSVEAMSLTTKPWVPGPLAIFRRDVFDAIGGYNESVTYAEDHEIGVALTKYGKRIDILREVLYIYSFRRYKKEGLLKALERAIKSTAFITYTSRGMKRMPGFVGGGEIFTEEQEKRKFRFISKGLEQKVQRLLHEFIK